MKKTFALVAIFFLFILESPVVFASGLGISASSRTVTTGGSVTVTVNASGLIGRFSVTSSNGNVLSGGTSSEWIEDGSHSFRFTAKSTGSATITVNCLDVSTTSGENYTGSRSVTINVVAPRKKSNNNYLSGLSVEGHSITPEFSKDTSEYSLEVPAETEKIQINASKEDSYASVDGAGEKEVSEGDNRFEIKVTSETGRERVYVLNVNVKDNNPISVEINKQKYTVVKKASSLQKPELFEEKKVTIDGIEVPGFYNETAKMTLIGIRNEKGVISFAIYNEKEKTYAKYQPITSANITIISLPTAENFKEYSKVTAQIGEEEYEGYQINSKSNFIYFYGLRADTGKSAWYVYDKNEKTLQLYQEEEAKKIEEEYEKKIQENKVVIAILGGTSILLLIILLIVTRKSSTKERRKQKKEIVDEIFKEMDTVENEKKKEKIKESTTILETTRPLEKTVISDNKAPVDDDFLDILGSTKVDIQVDKEDKKEKQKEEKSDIKEKTEESKEKPQSKEPTKKKKPKKNIKKNDPQ